MTHSVAKPQEYVLPVLTVGILPTLVMIAPKGTVTMLLLVGLYGIVLAIKRRALRQVFPPVLTTLFALGMAWMLFQSLATFDGRITILLWFRLLPLMVCGFGVLWLFRNLSLEVRRLVHNALIIGTAVSLAVLLAAYVATLLGRKDFLGPGHPDPMVHFSSGQMIVTILSSVVLGILINRRRHIWAVTLFVTMLALFLPLSSMISVVALAASAIGLLIGKIVPASKRKFIVASIILAVLAIPISMSFLSRDFAESPKLKTTLEAVDFAPGLDHSIAHRLQIWLFVTERAKEYQVFGWGLDASRSLPKGKDLTSLGESQLPLHPHNAVLQVWLELGVPGVIILALIIGYSGMHLSSSLTSVAAVRIGTILPTMVVGGLAFGIWQNWWVSSLWLVAAIVATFQPRAFFDHLGS